MGCRRCRRVLCLCVAVCVCVQVPTKSKPHTHIGIRIMFYPKRLKIAALGCSLRWANRVGKCGSQARAAVEAEEEARGEQEPKAGSGLRPNNWLDVLWLYTRTHAHARTDVGFNIQLIKHQMHWHTPYCTYTPVCVCVFVCLCLAHTLLRAPMFACKVLACIFYVPQQEKCLSLLWEALCPTPDSADT